MEYEIIQPPFKLDFRTMKRSEAVAYFNWFTEQIPVRISILTDFVQASPGYEAWQADLTPGSLSILGRWFYHNVKIRPRIDSERDPGGG